jgi:hypothetical protein
LPAPKQFKPQLPDEQLIADMQNEMEVEQAKMQLGGQRGTSEFDGDAQVCREEERS